MEIFIAIAFIGGVGGLLNDIFESLPFKAQNIIAISLIIGVTAAIITA